MGLAVGKQVQAAPGQHPCRVDGRQSPSEPRPQTAGACLMPRRQLPLPQWVVAVQSHVGCTKERSWGNWFPPLVARPLPTRSQHCSWEQAEGTPDQQAGDGEGLASPRSGELGTWVGSRVCRDGPGEAGAPCQGLQPAWTRPPGCRTPPPGFPGPQAAAQEQLEALGEGKASLALERDAVM